MFAYRSLYNLIFYMYAAANYIFWKNVHSLTHSGGAVVSNAPADIFFVYEDDFHDLAVSTV